MTATVAEPKRSPAKEQDIDLDAVVSATQARLMERPELLQMRMENETIMTECKKHPRDMAKIRADLSALLDSFPEFAEDAVYCKPCGKDDSGKQVFAEGLSIRAAEALAEMYGANRVRADVSIIDELHVKVDANFTDFERGRIWQDGAIVSKRYKGRTGQMREHNEDRFHNVVVKAEKSKIVREVICRSVNAALKAWFQNECKKVAAKTIGAEDVQAILKFWKDLGVSRERVEAFVGKPAAMGWQQNDKVQLRQLAVAIREGETSIDEAFGAANPTNGTAAATLDALAEKVETKAKAKKSPEPAVDPMDGPEAEWPTEDGGQLFETAPDASEA